MKKIIIIRLIQLIPLMNDARYPYIVDGIKYAADFPYEFAINHLNNTGPAFCGNCAYFGCNDNDEFFGYCLNCIELYEEKRPSGSDPRNNENYCQDCYTKLSAIDKIGHVCDNDDVDVDWFNPSETTDMDDYSKTTDMDDYSPDCTHGAQSGSGVYHGFSMCHRSHCDCMCYNCWFSRYPEFNCMHQYTQCKDVATCQCSCERCYTTDDKRDRDLY